MSRFVTALCAILALTLAASAQEPQLLRPPTAKSIDKEGAAMVDPDAEEEVQSHVSTATAPHDLAAPGLGAHGAAAVNGQFGGFPYNGAWHAGYQHPLWGRPVALVVPPVSHYQTIYGWGIATTQITPIYPQFTGPTFGAATGDFGPYRMPPYWPWDTRQFGVYYIRGPW